MPGPIQPIPQNSSFSRNFSLLIVEQERFSRESAKQVAEKLGFAVAAVENFAAAMRHLSIHAVDLVILEAGSSSTETQDMVAGIKAVQPGMEILLAGRAPQAQGLLRIVKSSAYEFLRKPWKSEELMRVLQGAAERHYGRHVNGSENNQPEHENGLVGQSPDMLRLSRIIQRTASSRHPILILGERGAGKTKLARVIHDSGALREKPFVTLDCAASPTSLLESRLFGSTSAGATERPALASGGTVYLDAIGHLPLNVQGRLFRALQEKELRVAGEGKPVPVDVRVIASTVRDLDTAVQQGTFRRDLYLRLNVVALRLPALRERREDIAAIAQHFLQLLGQEGGVQYSLSPEAMKLVLTYDWPGNVRELEHALRHAVSACDGTVLAPVHLPPEVQVAGTQSSLPSSETGRILPLAEVERKAILDTLHQLNGNKQMAAQMLGIGKTTLYRKLKEYGIGRRPGDRQFLP